MPTIPPTVTRPKGAVAATAALLLAGCAPAPAPLFTDRPAAERSARPAAGPVEIAFDVQPGDAWVARVEQRDFDAGVQIVDAGGRALAEFASPARGGGHELVFREAAAAERLTLRVAAIEPAAASATLRVELFRVSPGDIDPERRRALRAMTAAAQVSGPTGARRPETAVAQYGEAEQAWRRSGERRLAAEAALQLAGLHYWEREDWSAAVAAAARALADTSAGDDPNLHADAGFLWGSAALELARSGVASRTPGAAAAGPAATPDVYDAPVAALLAARDAFERTGRPADAARAVIAVALADYYRGDFDSAISRFESAGETLRAVGAARDVDLVAQNLATIRLDRGDYAGAVRDLETLLASPALRSARTRAGPLQNLAVALLVVGESERALAANRESLALATELRSEDLQARALLGLGLCHAQLGQTDLALVYLRDAIELRRRQAQPELLAGALAQLGEVQLRRGDVRAATGLARDALASAGPSARPLLRARLLLGLGRAQAADGRHREAIATWSQLLELPIPASHATVARTLVARAAAYRAIGDREAAGADAARAAQLAAAADIREELIAAQVELARLAVAAGDAGAALTAADAAVSTIEGLPVGAANPDNRVTLAARLRDAYELRVELLAGQALEARARGDHAGADALALAALRATVRGGPDAPDRATPADPREQDVYARLAARRYRLELLAERNAEPTPTMRALESEIALLRTGLASGTSTALGAGPRPRTVGPMPARDSAVTRPLAPRSAGPDVDTVVYSLGREASWAWWLADGRVELRRLPGRAQLDGRVRALLARIRALAPPDELKRELRLLERAILDTTPPAAGRRWRIAVDGPLGAVPWALLAARRGVASVTLLPSVASLYEPAAPRQPRPDVVGPATSPSPTPGPATLRIALFGDPVFAASDPRVPAVVAASLAVGERRDAGRGDDARRAVADPAARALARLPGSGREIDAIAAIAGESVALRASGFEATRDALLRLPLDRVDVLHIATHASLDPAIPELAALELSRLDAAGRLLDGALRAADVRRLRAAPSLVVLTACDAAREPSAAVDGLMNLVRAFLAARSRHVVASLWEVGDASAIELMSRFYMGLLQDGLAPEAALARAQRELAASPRWSAPFHWAGFVLTEAAP